MAAIVPVILSGGSGTRLWPLSRSMFPKQFIRFFRSQRDSFLGATLARIAPGPEFAAPIVMCNNDHRFLIRDELERAGIAEAKVVLEPVSRNTAVAIAVAGLVALERSADAVLAVMPSDHAIKDGPAFVRALIEAGRIAAGGRLVLFGIPPASPHTGYGYIRRGDPLEAEAANAYAVDAFVEKPDRATAEGYLAAGTYFWNSGIFVLHAQTFLDELGRFEPAVLAAARGALAAASVDLGFVRLAKAPFARSPNISVDYAVMERTRRAAMLPIDVGWSDVGSWSSLWEIGPRDGAQNVVNADAVLEDTRNCYIHSERSLVATIGLDNLVIVDTPDALLVADRNRAQEVSRLVTALRESGRKEQEQHLRNYRPWGWFETLAIGPRFQVKTLHVKPGSKLSMQMHHHRSEHWVVVQGTALVTVGDSEKLVRENESVYISATQWHRLTNPGKVPLELIEVQIGTYLGEDDIQRTDDIYQRAPEETK
jgi:mannose-1-phosphate guanylyltransferase/mannose-6-phosphate isomerase